MIYKNLPLSHVNCAKREISKPYLNTNMSVFDFPIDMRKKQVGVVKQFCKKWRGLPIIRRKVFEFPSVPITDREMCVLIARQPNSVIDLFPSMHIKTKSGNIINLQYKIFRTLVIRKGRLIQNILRITPEEYKSLLRCAERMELE